MRIGIDIDDTTLDTLTSMLKYADIFSVEVLNKPTTKKNLGEIKNRYYLNALFGWNDEEKMLFFDKYYKNVLEECTPKDNSPRIIEKLKKENHNIYFISARLTFIKDCPTEKITKESFKKYNIPYDKIIIAAYDKLDYCIDNNIDIFIDDSLEVLTELSNHNIRCYLMTTPMNANLETPSKIKRVDNWDEIYNDLKEVQNDSTISN